MQARINKRLLFVSLYLASPFFLIAQQIDTIRITEYFSNVPMQEALSRLESSYHLKFYFKTTWFENTQINLSVDSATVTGTINRLLAGKPFDYRIINGNKIVILPSEQVSLLINDLKDYSEGLSIQDFILVGKAEDAGIQKTPIISGKIIDGKTGEPIIGAMIQVNNLNQGAATDADGNYKLVLAPGMYTLTVNSVGYEKNELYIKLISNGELNIELFDKSIDIDDIIIYGQRVDKNVTSNQMSLVELDVQSIKQLPAVAGDRDILKGLTTMPGVKSIGEFSSGINVRGGGEDQNLYLLNGAPLFNTTHVFGLFSVINPDVVDRLTLYKGHIPAYYGERVSSVIDIQTLQNAPEKLRIRGGIGLYDSKLTLLVPVYRNNIYLDISGRTSYSNWILHNINDYQLTNSSAFFYDINGTLHFSLPKNLITISAYSSYDEFKFASEVDYKYDSEVGSFNWNYMVSPSLGSYLTLAYSNYQVKKDDISTTYKKNSIESGIRYIGMDYRLKFTGILKNTLDGGFNLVNYLIHPGEMHPLEFTTSIDYAKLDAESAWEGAVFLNDEYKINEYFVVNAGIRLSGFQQTDNKLIFGLEPRISTRIKLGESSSVKLSYNRNFQYISLISLSSVSTPGDIWKLCDSKIKPLTANQIAVGYYRNFHNNSIETSVEVYYKKLNNIIEYEDGAVLEMNPDLENTLLNAEGKNYGVEFLLKKNGGTVDGWISYTYSKSLRRSTTNDSEKSINDGKYFPSSYDKPHDLTVVANLHVNKRLRLSANFTYSTGRPITIPESEISVENLVPIDDISDPLEIDYSDVTAVVFSDRNEYRIPDYHRLDISITLDESLKKKKKWKGSWTLSILNVYGRKNPYTVFYRKDMTANSQNDYNFYNMYKMYLIGNPVPTLTYTFIF